MVSMKLHEIKIAQGLSIPHDPRTHSDPFIGVKDGNNPRFFVSSGSNHPDWLASVFHGHSVDFGIFLASVDHIDIRKTQL